MSGLLKLPSSFLLLNFFILCYISAHTSCFLSGNTIESIISSHGGGIRDNFSFWLTKTFGLPTRCVTNFFPLYPYTLLQQLHEFLFLVLATLPVNDKQMQCFSIIFGCVLILLLLLISGNVHPVCYLMIFMNANHWVFSQVSICTQNWMI